jgi:mannose-1-phosphate guanylyltransferase
VSSNFYALIMAGGSGTRLWPLSRQSRPKQAIELIGSRTMLQHAVDRLGSLLPPEQIMVVTASRWRILSSSRWRVALPERSVWPQYISTIEIQRR